MVWVNAKERIPQPFVRVWVRTSIAKQTTAYLNSQCVWVFNCKRIAAESPTVISWREI